MLNQDIYLVNPASRKIVNEGVASVSDETASVLRYELETFVCDGQYEKGLEHIFDVYLRNLNQAQQPGVWVSGFYGSGKSHLVKMLCALWTDRNFPDGSTARGLVNVPDAIRSHLKELNLQGRRHGGLHAASGTLGAGAGGSVRLALLGIIFKSAGLPERYSLARFVMWLKNDGIYDAVRQKVEDKGSIWNEELDNLYVAEDLHQALVEVKPNVFADTLVCAETLIHQYPNVQDVSNDDMVKTIRQALTQDGKFPLTLVVLDEVQQYIGENGQRSLDVQEVVETCCKTIGSHLLFIATGQTAVSGTSNLKKLEGRFTVRIELSDTDVNAVVRKVILAKKPDAIDGLKQVMQINMGEISRHLSGTNIGHSQQDAEFFSQDYPIVPVRRRFWEYALRVLDQTGTDSQLRNQLTMVHRAAKTNLNSEVGNVITADFLYFDLADKLLQARILPRIVHEKTMIWLGQGETEKLMARACGLVFLINRLARNNQEIGIKATVDTLADLLVSDLAAGSSDLRSKLPSILDNCDLLMKVKDEYCIQTEESMAWRDEYESQKNVLANETYRLAAEREDRLKRKFSEVVGKLTINQGQSKITREIAPVFDVALPTTAKDKVCLWVRNEWGVEEDTVRVDARQAGQQSPIIYLFIPKRSADDLRTNIIEYKAAESTLAKKGVPTEGGEAREAMETRRFSSETKINELLEEALSGTKVYQAGGNEILAATLKEAVIEAANNALQRLYPQFALADHNGWGNVYNKARTGAPDALNAVGFDGDPVSHPVCKSILAYIAAGKTGADIRKHFEGGAYGWSPDAVDGALLVLMVAGQVRAVDEHVRTVEPKGIERRQIAKLSFHVENIVVQIGHRLKVRKLHQKLGIKFDSGKETAKVTEFLTVMQELADSAGGLPPKPEKQDTNLLTEIRQKSANEQLIMIADNSDLLNGLIDAWLATKEKIALRQPAWEKLQRLLHTNGAVAVVGDIMAQVNAVADKRLLLADPDSVTPLLKSLEDVLRNHLNTYYQNYQKTYLGGLEELAQNSAWQKIGQDRQSAILIACGINQPDNISSGTYEELLASLQKYPLSSWPDRIEALKGRLQKARELAIQELEPKIQLCDIPKRTLKNSDDIEAWLNEVRQQLEKAIEKGPIMTR